MKPRAWRGFVWTGVLLALIILTSTNSSWAAERKYPLHPITLIAGFPPGGSVDIVNRLWVKYLEKYLGVPIVVDYKPGAGGTVANNALANSRPDGYTIANSSDVVIVAILLGQASYSVPEDVRVVAQVSHFTNVLAVKADSPWKTFQDFMNYAKKNPGVKYAHPGVGSTPHIAIQHLSKTANLSLVPVPFKSTPECITAVLGGHLPIGVFSPMAVIPNVEAGKMRMLFSLEPADKSGLDPSIPDYASVFGKSDYIDTTTYILAHGKTPVEILKVLEQAVEKMSKDPEYLSELKKNYARSDFIDGDTVMKNIVPAKMSRLKGALQDAGLIQ
jgi:tripartite-type tricarboxylate transporter receptor subunit TctC